MGVKGDFGSVKAFKSRLRELPRTLAHEVAKRASPAMTDLTREAFDGGRNVYGETRPQGVDGNPLTLEATGETRRTLRFTTTGTIVRCVLGTRYARYLIGRYQILPNGGLPTRWRDRLRQIVREAGRDAL